MMDEFRTADTADEAFEIRKKKKSIDPLPIVFVLLLGLCIALTLVLMQRTDPKRLVKREAAANYDAFMHENRISAELFDQETIDALLGGEYSANGSIRLDNNTVYEKANGVSLGVQADMASADREVSGTLSGGYGGINVIEIQGYGDKDTTTAYIPAVFKESFTIENKNVVSQLKKLPVVGERFEGIPDFDMNLFIVSDATAAAHKLKKAVWALWLLQKTGLVPSLEYKKADKVTAPDGNSYNSYTVTVPGRDAVETAVNFFGKLADMEEYKNAVDKDLDFVFAVLPGLSRRYGGDKAEAKAELGAAPAEIEKAIRGINAEDVDISVTPLNNGIIFGIDQELGGYHVKLDGDYDRTGNTLVLKLDLRGEGADLELVYYDKCDKTGSAVNEMRTLYADWNGYEVRGSAETKYDLSDHSLTSEFSVIEGDNDAYTVKFDGTAKKNEQTVDFTADSIKYTNGAIEAEFSGELSVGKRQNEPQRINAAENVKISDIDFIKALELYSEAAEKLKGLKSMVKILG